MTKLDITRVYYALILVGKLGELGHQTNEDVFNSFQIQDNVKELYLQLKLIEDENSEEFDIIAEQILSYEN